MQYIHFPTLLFHGGLVLLAQLTINHYHDAFLSIGVLLLVVHAVWAIRSKKWLMPSHLLGCAAQFAVFATGLIEVHSGAFGLGGGEFALFFYQCALGISAFVELLIGLLKRCKE